MNGAMKCMVKYMVKYMAAIAVSVLTGSALTAQQPAGTAAGERLFAANCAVCHGVDGTGGTSPVNLARGEFRHGSSGQELFNTISKGIPGTEMPGSFLKPDEIRQVVEFVRGLANLSGGSAVVGRAARGEELFRTQGCVACHQVTEQGSHAEAQLGPNLFGIGDRRATDTLRDSILRVHSGLAEYRWNVSAVTQAGKRVSGTRLNEDTHSIQLRDTSNNLVSLLKSELSELKVERSDRLPEFQNALSDADTSDLAAYLSTLRRRNAQ